MSLLNRLLSRFPITRHPRSLPVATTDLEARVGKTINDALASAGLMARVPVAAPVAASPRTSPHLRAEPTQETSRPAPLPGSFVEESFSGTGGTCRYKLYVPAGYSVHPAVRYPLVLMLHGCTQSPDDFAIGTGMNALADRHGFLVVYPAQSPNANGSKCWNWFRPGDQARGAGEPALLAGLTESLIARHAVDPRRVYVAGLSAGAAMAVILGATYPEFYAAVGAHSGLPYRAARDVSSAFAAMGGTHALREADAAVRAAEAQERVTPLIVFHGDADHTVAPANGDALVMQAAGAASALPPESKVTGIAGDGRSYTRSVYTTALGDPMVEYWQLHGSGHAWSGGSVGGSYTDPSGPDASAEMVRFFLQAGRAEQD